MNKKYTRFSFEERIQLEKLLSHNQSYSQIARALNRNKSTISREVKRIKVYSAVYANWNMVYKASDRRRFKSKINQNPALKAFVLSKLRKKWSPDQISVSLKMNFPNDNSMQLSRESIYFYVYVHCKKSLKEELTKELRQQRKFRGNTRRGADKRTTITEAIRIDERPPEVPGREVPGHWEGDLILGKDRLSAIGTLVERTTRALILVHLKARDSRTVRLAFQKKFNSLPELMKKSLTYDNGTEMAQHKLFTKNTKVQVYFTHPYSPWERPTNENTNGLLRQYFPKGMDLSKVSKKELQHVQDEMNERPRRTLGYKSPAQVFEEMILKKIKN
ncbi:MAG: IS30 family transposase [Ferruginibacter sp.]|jgi:IS30 family transposase